MLQGTSTGRKRRYSLYRIVSQSLQLLHVELLLTKRVVTSRGESQKAKSDVPRQVKYQIRGFTFNSFKAHRTRNT